MDRLRQAHFTTSQAPSASRISDTSTTASQLSTASRFASHKKAVVHPPTSSSLASASVSRLSRGQSSISSSRRSRKKKKEDLARIIDDRGRDVTPLPLTGVYSSLPSLVPSLVPLTRPLDDPSLPSHLQHAPGSGLSSWSLTEDDDPYAPLTSDRADPLARPAACAYRE